MFDALLRMQLGPSVERLAEMEANSKTDTRLPSVAM